MRPRMVSEGGLGRIPGSQQTGARSKAAPLCPLGIGLPSSKWPGQYIFSGVWELRDRAWHVNINSAAINRLIIIWSCSVSTCDPLPLFNNDLFWESKQAEKRTNGISFI